MKRGQVSSVDIAAELGVTQPSVSYAVKNLKENGYITMEKSGEIYLTKKGEEIAESMYERHTLICGLLKYMGVEDSFAHEDACKIEHDLSAETFAALKAFAEENGIEPHDD
jgi:Mn-dependent DtxR family transcriptional regulator